MVVQEYITLFNFSVYALINTFMLMYIPSNVMGKITAIALAIFVIYFGLKAKENSRKEIR